MAEIYHRSQQKGFSIVSNFLVTSKHTKHSHLYKDAPPRGGKDAVGQSATNEKPPLIPLLFPHHLPRRWHHLRLPGVEKTTHPFRLDHSREKLGAAYTAGAWSVQGGRLVFGILRDRFGTRLIAQVSFSCVICGAFGIAFQSVSNEIALGVNLFLLGLGSGAQLCVQPVAQLFPKNSALFMSGLSGAFQVSGVVYAVLVGIAKKTSEEGELTVAYGGALRGSGRVDARVGVLDVA